MTRIHLASRHAHAVRTEQRLLATCKSSSESSSAAAAAGSTGGCCCRERKAPALPMSGGAAVPLLRFLLGVPAAFSSTCLLRRAAALAGLATSSALSKALAGTWGRCARRAGGRRRRRIGPVCCEHGCLGVCRRCCISVSTRPEGSSAHFRFAGLLAGLLLRTRFLHLQACTGQVREWQTWL